MLNGKKVHAEDEAARPAAEEEKGKEKVEKNAIGKKNDLA